jgi:ABC-2 type transport system permease protein
MRKELTHVLRDKRSLLVLVVVPAFMLVMFGYALSYDVSHVPIAILDNDRSVVSRDLISTCLRTEYFDDAARLTSESEIDRQLTGGPIKAVLVIPVGFERDVRANRPASVQVLIDGANSTIAATVAGYLTAIVQDYSTSITLKTLERKGIASIAVPLDFRPRVWYNPELRSAKFLVPGLIGFILMISTMVSTSLSIVREKEKGTIEQLIVSPIRPLELLIGKTLPYVAISLVSTVLILIAGYVLFDVAVQGSLFLLFLVTLLFIFCGLGAGIFVSTVANTQEEAFMLSATLAVLPTFMLSGFTFPIRNMPVVLQYLTYINPARYFLWSLRAIILKGAGLDVFWKELLFMCLFAIWIVTVSWNKMRKELA